MKSFFKKNENEMKQQQPAFYQVEVSSFFFLVAFCLYLALYALV